ncbi:MAG TPA: class I fructose-bisphosphate aldolase [Puia sp.]|jgi:fructose-bisphosphate aldolase class I|nr:class I fructose-bisphosphate aldolase [Puia sp.]
MRNQELITTAGVLMAGAKGLLAMDESTNSINNRFKKIGLSPTLDNRRAYRELIVTTPGLGDHLSGAILYDETVYQSTREGISFLEVLAAAGVMPGIKVDESTIKLAGFPDEKITRGLDTLRERLATYKELGLRFAKWRAVIRIDTDIPSKACIDANMLELARYAALCQEAGMVPIVEPEVLMDGNHSINRCFEVTEKVLEELFRQLMEQRVDLHGILLKPNMVLPGVASAQKVSIADVAGATLKCLLKHVPGAVPGIAFLSGGQSPTLATARLNAMHVAGSLPWALTFSYSRAIQQPALEHWNGKEENVEAAQQLLYDRIGLNALARQGKYEPGME